MIDKHTMYNPAQYIVLFQSFCNYWAIVHAIIGPKTLFLQYDLSILDIYYLKNDLNSNFI